jgi:hypothetical protein
MKNYPFTTPMHLPPQNKTKQNKALKVLLKSAISGTALPRVWLYLLD